MCGCLRRPTAALGLCALVRAWRGDRRQQVGVLAHAVAGAFDVADGTLIAQHGRRFGRDQLICDPRHYLPILERKPGALRSGTLFRQWDLPQSIQIVRDRILKQPKGDRAFVERLPMARDAGLEPLEVACDLVLDGNVVTASVVINAMRRLIAPMHPVTMSVPEMLKLEVEPLADCGRYGRLRGAVYVIH